MRILWVKTELLHPVDKGGKIRTYQMLRALRRQHDLTYLCLDDGSAAPNALALASEYSTQAIAVPFSPPAKGTVAFFAALAGNLLSGLPYAVARYRSSALQRRIVELAPDADLVVCDFLAPSLNVPAELPTRAVLFQHNVEAMIWQRHASVPQSAVRKAYMTEQWRRMRRLERDECRRYAHVVAVSDVDARVFREDYGVKSVSSVKTGVDLEFFTPTPHADRNPAEIVFVGSMDWLPNEDGIRWFLEDVFPLVRKARPEARLTVVGRAPPASLVKLAGETGGVEVTGTVDDVRPYLARAGVSVVPLRIGGGTRLKIYEAMAAGTPVVSTTIGAEGLPLDNGQHLLLADEPQALAAALVSVIAAPARGAALAEAALAYVREHCGWDAVAQEFVDNCMA